MAAITARRIPRSAREIWRPIAAPVPEADRYLGQYSVERSSKGATITPPYSSKLRYPSLDPYIRYFGLCKIPWTSKASWAHNRDYESLEVCSGVNYVLFIRDGASTGLVRIHLSTSNGSSPLLDRRFQGADQGKHDMSYVVTAFVRSL